MLRQSPGIDATVMQETLFYEYIQSLHKHRHGRFGFAIDLGLLTPKYRSPRHMRIVQGLVNNIDNSRTGRVFHMEGGRVIGLYMDVTQTELDHLKMRLFDTFGHDAMVRGEFEKTDEENRFIRFIDVAKDYEALLADARTMHEGGLQGIKAARGTSNKLDILFTGMVKAKTQKASKPKQDVKAPVSDNKPQVSSLKESAINVLRPLMKKLTRSVDVRPYNIDDAAAVLKKLETMNVAQVAEIKHTYFYSDTEIKPVFEEYFVPYRALVGDLLENTKLGVSFWMNGLLHDRLNAAILTSLSRMPKRENKVPLNIRATLNRSIEEDFKSFVSFYVLENGPFIVEFSIHDVLANPIWYVQLRTMLHQNKCLVCVGDIDAYSFLGLDRTFLEADFEKVRPGRNLDVMSDVNFRAHFRKTINQIGREKVILTGCQTQDHLEEGLGVGIQLYEGPFLDAMMGN